MRVIETEGNGMSERVNETHRVTERRKRQEQRDRDKQKLSGGRGGRDIERGHSLTDRKRWK